ncbi:MAG: hypothetical protein WCI04_05025 [archaeon]
MEQFIESDTFAIILVICIFAGIIIFFKWYFGGKWVNKIRIPTHLPKEGFLVQLVGVSSLLSHNSLFPKIKLFENYFEYRILLKKKINYSDLAKIEVIKYSIMPKDIIIYINNGGRLWLAPGNEQNLNELVKFFNAKANLLDRK